VDSCPDADDAIRFDVIKACRGHPSSPAQLDLMGSPNRQGALLVFSWGTLYLNGGLAMKKAIAFLATVAFWAVCAMAYSDYSVTDRGEWPKSWPSELEPLRAQARTFEGPLAPDRHYAIPFTGRDEFESAWPYLLKVKSQGAHLVLRRGPNFFLGDARAGVVIHTPPLDQADNAQTRGIRTTYIELLVDGQIVDLNRIRLPTGGSIVDERFKEGKNK
jgi:hypothetical protein